jgi:hypothetical protein
MCEYCEKPIGDAITDSGWMSIWIEDHYPSGKDINASFSFGEYDDAVYCVIHYCPMCGRKLEA